MIVAEQNQADAIPLELRQLPQWLEMHRSCEVSP